MRSAPAQKRRMGPCSALLAVPKSHDRQIDPSYLMDSSLLGNPLRDLPQSLNREQRGFGDTETRISWPRVVGQAGSDSSMIAVGHANDEVRICPASHTNELDALAVQRMGGVRHGHPFLRSFGK